MSSKRKMAATTVETAENSSIPISKRRKIPVQNEPDTNGSQDVDVEAEQEENKPSTRRTRLVTHVGSSSAPNKRRASSTPAVQDAEGAFEGFEGDTFQKAQEKIVTELINYRDDDNSPPVFSPFVNLPSRTLVDYYKVIRNPVSLKSAQKAVRGIKGRDKPTDVTFLKSWAAFEGEIRKIWENARTYNEDGSDISNLAGELEEYFHRRLAEAKRAVAEPTQPRVKLRMPAKSPEPSKITLKFGGQKSNATPAMSVDNEALKRQQELVRAGANGHATVPASKLSPNLARATSEKGKAINQMPNGLKSESSNAQSPALDAIQPNGANEARKSPNPATIQMPPPTTMSTRLPSGSPNPQTLTNGPATTSSSSTSAVNSRFRQSGKGISDALITSLNIRSHDGLQVENHISLDIPASPNRTQQSRTITIPYSHYFLKITPTVSSSLLHRPSKTVVTCSNPTPQRLQQVPQKEADPRRPVYETRISPGVNVIDVEVIAGPPRGAPKIGAGQDIDFEKFTVFVHLQKS